MSLTKSPKLLLFFCFSSLTSFALGLHQGQPGTSFDSKRSAPEEVSDPNGRVGIESEESDLACSAITNVVDLRRLAAIPSTIKQWRERLADFGTVENSLVSFSRAPTQTRLSSARVISTLSEPDEEQGKPNLVGKLFFGFVKNPEGNKDLEFISWNRRRKAYDFGVVKNFDAPSKRKLILNAEKSGNCLSCHRNHGPIFSSAPWSETNSKIENALGMLREMTRLDPKKFGPFLEIAERLIDDKDRDRNEGTRAVIQDPELKELSYWMNGEDTGVKLFEGGQLLFGSTGMVDIRATLTGRSSLIVNQIANRLSVESRVPFVRALMMKDLARFGEGENLFNGKIIDALSSLAQKEAKSIKREGLTLRVPGTIPGHIKDFDSQSGKIAETGLPNQVGSLEDVASLDKARWEAGPNLPKAARPSDLETFQAADDEPKKPVTLAKALDLELPFALVTNKDIGLIGGWLRLEAERLAQAKGEVWDDKKRDEKRTSLLEQALRSKTAGAAFAQGVPSREKLLSIIHQGIAEVLQSQGVKPLSSLEPHDACEDSTAMSPRLAAGESDLGLCRRCHLGAEKTGIMKFPFDPESRDAWDEALKGDAPKKSTQKFLKRVLRRLTDGDMPPEDEVESQLLERQPERRKELDELREYLKSQVEK